MRPLLLWLRPLFLMLTVMLTVCQNAWAMDPSHLAALSLDGEGTAQVCCDTHGDAGAPAPDTPLDTSSDAPAHSLSCEEDRGEPPEHPLAPTLRLPGALPPALPPVDTRLRPAAPWLSLPLRPPQALIA